MADQRSADQILPAFWSLSPSFLRSEPDLGDRHHQDPQFLTMDSADLLNLRLGLGLGFHGRQYQDEDWSSDEFFIGRRNGDSLSGSGSGSASEFSRACPIDDDGLRISRLESEDSDSDEQIVAIGDDSFPNDQIQIQEGMNGPSFDLNVVPLCWDCLRIDDDRRDLNEEFEWEEVEEQNQGGDGAAINNVEWEVLLTNLGNGEDAESYFDEGFVYAASDYDEITFAQFQEDAALKGSPPAAKSAVENLPSFVLMKEDVEKSYGCIGCAVCKDEISVGEEAKRLPCSHCYHEECILPWLETRNTCPLCRYELPTDDPEYESWKARRAAGNADVGVLEIVDDESIRYDFEMLPEA